MEDEHELDFPKRWSSSPTAELQSGDGTETGPET